MKRESVNHPSHYGGQDNPIEHIKVVEALGWNYCLGNCTKYLWRAGKKSKNVLEDLRKALWYLNREIQRLEREQEDQKLRVRTVRPQPRARRRGVLPLRRGR